MTYWQQVRDWYIRNGFDAAALHMQEIKSAWMDDGARLLAKLEAYSARLEATDPNTRERLAASR